MTSSNGNIFRVMAICAWNSPVPGDAELFWCFLWSASEYRYWVNNREAGDLRRYAAHYDVIVMLVVWFSWRDWNIDVVRVVSEVMDGWWMNEWVNVWVNGWMKETVNEWVNWLWLILERGRALSSKWIVSYFIYFSLCNMSLNTFRAFYSQ